MNKGKRCDREIIDYKAFVEVFNTHGKEAALEHVAERYSIQYNTVVRRLRAESVYRYDQSRERYYLKDGVEDTANFLTIEELTRPHQPAERKIYNVNNDAVLNLIVDRFFELDRYVKLQNRERKIIINQTSAKAEGYNMEYV